MTPKPLTKERRAEILADLCAFRADDPDYIDKAIDELLAAEAYWREAVKNARPKADLDYEIPFSHCPFCKCADFDIRGIYGNLHKPDCPWLLSQEY